MVYNASTLTTGKTEGLFPTNLLLSRYTKSRYALGIDYITRIGLGKIHCATTGPEGPHPAISAPRPLHMTLVWEKREQAAFHTMYLASVFGGTPRYCSRSIRRVAVAGLFSSESHTCLSCLKLALRI